MSIEALQQEFTRPLQIATYEVDRERRLRLSAQLKLQQEIGEQHLQAAGMPYAALYEQGVAFVLIQIRTLIYRLPTLEEKGTLRTWKGERQGAQTLRHYQFAGADGALCWACTGAFVVVDPASHRLLRHSPFDAAMAMVCGKPQPEQTRIEKLILPEGLEPAGTRAIRYSDIDYNGHCNNTVYADFLYDYLPEDDRTKTLRAYTLRFIGEAALGDTLTLSSARAGGCFYLQGEHGRGLCFQAKMEFADDETAGRS